MFVGINHVTVIVANKKDAADFYFYILGFERIDVGKSLWAKVGNQFIHINENSEFVNQESFSHFAVEVENLKSYLEELIKKGVEVFDLSSQLQKTDINANLDKTGRNYFIKDPSGNIIEFIDKSNSFFKQ